MARRRPLTGKPLLLATAGALLVGCGNKNTNNIEQMGNLMPPPMERGEVCIDTKPEDATVMINGMIMKERCNTVETEGRFRLEVSKPGFETDSRELSIAPKIDLKIVLQSATESPVMPPVGNLMPPPMDRPDVEPRPPEKPK